MLKELFSYLAMFGNNDEEEVRLEDSNPSTETTEIQEQNINNLEGCFSDTSPYATINGDINDFVCHGIGDWNGIDDNFSGFGTDFDDF